MKAEVSHQRLLLELTALDAELSRIAHRSKTLAEQKRFDELQAEQRAAQDRLAVLQIAVEDLDGQVSRFESEIDGVRQREDRDRSLLESGTVNPKQLAEIQHELETLERRQASLEDSVLEVMERREELVNQQAVEQIEIDRLNGEVATAAQARDIALAEIEQTRSVAGIRRTELAQTISADLVAVYERQRTSTGVGAGLLQGRRCGACRIEIDRGQSAQITAAPEDDVVRCPECGAILLRFTGIGS
ncbi:zinc ribbon domain-containing protein [Mycolicibacterium mengxianglii]|uniref:zinc ribbon domain-containing protein n=1 Tax=Mycolicibacterium mengxianglii TaxID=2736649 RepID=UPI0018D1D153|nr:C4-type zinc ribbon domain-containing protein [Mycolicibacterium mengxianglii]